MKKNFFTIMAVLLLGSTSFANGILVANASLSNQNTASHTTTINFDVSWENSWRTSTNENNYDGAWIFVKYRKNGTTDWRHATINMTGFTAGDKAAIKVPTDGKGAFIYRSANGIGNIEFAGNKLVWNYGTDGLLDNETVEIRVFALEMVYIPTGSYSLGSGGAESYAFSNGSTKSPYLVAGNGSINLGTAAGSLNPNANGPAAGTIPALFPKGYNAFWIMKYECSQQQYVDFLNHLDLARATVNKTATIFTGTHPNLIAPEPDGGIGELGFKRTAALSDWSGLRPMSELEFEKASRGYNTPAVPNEYVWGNTTVIPVTTVANQGAEDEAVSTPSDANANIAGNLNALVRVGIFARPNASTRVLSGATYYGVMNMGDNLFETCFSIVNATGRAIDESVNGDGYLDQDGNTDIDTWKQYTAYGFRGGSFSSQPDPARTSDRVNANFFASYPGDYNGNTNGIRMVRTAP